MVDLVRCFKRVFVVAEDQIGSLNLGFGSVNWILLAVVSSIGRQHIVPILSKNNVGFSNAISILQSLVGLRELLLVFLVVD